VAIEDIDSGAAPTNDMVYSDWLPYTNRLYAANWATLFTNTDFRSRLTWNSRLTNFNGAQVYNFYSSGEEALREWLVDPPTNILSGVAQIVQNYLVSQSPKASFVWVWQEKAKGRAQSDSFLGSTHGGWKFNTNYSSLTPAQAAALPDSQLSTNAFFDFTSASFTGDATLLDPLLGSYYASVYGKRILSDAIPALTWAVGSHPVPMLSPPQRPDQRNFDMNSLYQNSWPVSRPQSGPEAFKWYHSDFKDVAYTYTYKLFNQFVTVGNLK
jgi:hypothetical protein